MVVGVGGMVTPRTMRGVRCGESPSGDSLLHSLAWSKSTLKLVYRQQHH